MKRLIIFIILFSVYSNCFSQSGWFTLSTPFPNINDVQFLNSQTGFIVGTNGQFAISSNGGITWTVRNAPINQSMLSVSFINENTGWICGKNDTLGYFVSTMYKTSNAGVTWNLVSSTGFHSYYTDVHMLTRDSILLFTTYNDGWSTGGNSSYTFNSGSTFNNSAGEGGYSMKFLNKNTGWVCGSIEDDLGVIKTFVNKTINSGKDWNRIYKDTIRGGGNLIKKITNLFFINESTGFICGDKGRFAKTTNGGVNWTDLNINQSYIFSSLYFFNENTGYATASLYNSLADSSALKRTTDGGVTWTTMRNNALDRLKKITFVDNFTGWAIGLTGSLGGGLMKTITGGLTDVEQISSVVPDNYSLSQNYPNPFNPVTKINYELPISDYVSLKVYDMLGNEIETLVSEKQNQGSYSVTFNAVKYPSGVYFYKLVTEKFSETKKMLLVK